MANFQLDQLPPAHRAEAARQMADDNERKRPSRGPGKTALPIVQNGQPVTHQPRRHKYNAQATEIDGIRFDSKREAERYQELLLLAAAGEIHALSLQPRFELQPSFKREGKTIRAIHYVADFQYVENATDRLIVEEVKGFKGNPVWRLKYKLFLYRYPNVHLEIIS
jgi:hypothetical protein